MAFDQSQIKGHREAVKESLKYAKDLKSKFDKGEISQSDYISELGSFVPDAYKRGQEWAGYGSNYANEIRPDESELEKFYQDYNLYSSAKELLGRDITPQEYAQFKPKFKDIYDADTGRAYLAEISKQEAKSPDALKKKAPEYTGQVGGFYQDLLKRGATNEEADYFGRLLATGQVTPYEIQNFIKATPEYQTQEDTKFRSGLEGELAGYDEKAFKRERENILSQYATAGLKNSSALDFAITDALGKLQEQRGQFLGGLSAQQYGGNKELARRDYEQSLNQYLGNQDYGRNRSDAYLDYLTQRSDQSMDYQRQKNDYLQFLAAQPKQRRSGGLGQILGGIAGATIGGFTGGPVGAGAGYQIGSGVGGGFDYFNQ